MAIFNSYVKLPEGIMGCFRDDDLDDSGKVGVVHENNGGELTHLQFLRWSTI